MNTIYDNSHADSAEGIGQPHERKRPYWKLAVFLLSLILPGYIVSMFAWAILCSTLDINVRDTVSAETAAAYEQPVRDALAPMLSEKYDLSKFDVRYTRPGLFILGHRIWDTKEGGEGAVSIEVHGVSGWTQCFKLAKDIARMKREQPGLPHCLYVLSFQDADKKSPAWTPENAAEFPDHAIHGKLLRIAIPDPGHGYAGERRYLGARWHTDDFTPTKYYDDPYGVKR